MEGIEGASKADVAGEIIEQIQQQVLFPEVDLNQRLALSAGYGIADLLIPKNHGFGTRRCPVLLE